MQTSMANVKAFLEAVERCGVSSDALLAAAGFDKMRLARDAWLPIADAEVLLELGLSMTGDPAFGLHWGERPRMNTHGVLAPLVANAPTLRHAITDTRRFTRIVSEREPLHFAETRTRAVLYLDAPPCDLKYAYVMLEMTMVGFLRLLQYFAGSERPSLLVSFPYAAPPYVDEYVRIFGGDLRFEQDVASIEFDRTVLDRPQPYSDPDLYRALQTEAERYLARALGSSLAERLRTFLVRVSPRAPKLHESAAELGVSERSLRRRLADEGLTYSEILNQVRADTAQRLIARCSIEEAAYEMGFSSPTALHRAFKRWTGKSPLEFRRELAPPSTKGDREQMIVDGRISTPADVRRP